MTRILENMVPQLPGDTDGFDEYRCAYCGSESTSSIQQVSAGDSPMAIARCSNCGLSRLYPRMNRSAVARALEVANRQVEGHQPTYEVLSRAIYPRDDINFLTRHLGSLANLDVLDVGCAEGSWVEALVGFGARAQGIDPVQAPVDFGRRRGLDLHSGPFETGSLPPSVAERRFDLICFRESIYYMSDLKETFLLTHKLLRPGGKIFVLIHGIDSPRFWGGRQDISSYGRFSTFLPTAKVLWPIFEREGFTLFAEMSRYFNPLDSLSLYGKLGKSLPWRALNRGLSLLCHVAGLADRRGALFRSRDF